MRVASLAKALSVTPETVRYYTRKGLLHPERDDNSYKDYSLNDQQRLHFIVNARQLGFSVSDIEEILSKADDGETPCPTVRRLIEERLAETEKRFQDIKVLRDRMQKAVATWDQQPDGLPCGHSICHLIESIDVEEG